MKNNTSQMKLIDIIADILNKADNPLGNDDIFSLAKNHSQIGFCLEFNRVQVPKSAVARCLSKNSRGAKPILGILDEGKDKSSFKKFYIKNKVYSSNINLLSEADLHPILVKFAFERFNVHCKTINALKTKPKKDKVGKWTNPDIVGINPIILSLNKLLRNEVGKQGILSTKVFQFYSFELKLKLDKFTLTDNYFQAVSNSAWANFGYLVVEDLDMDKVFLENLTRLRDGYGIGIIKLNIENPVKSEVIIAAREKEIVDINFMNFLCDNTDFYDFLENCSSIIDTNTLKSTLFDAIL